MTLAEARDLIGKAVIYRPDDDGSYKPTARRAEQGIVTSVNDVWVFVRYGSDHHSKATAPRDLEPLR
jgi:hypothetical protein